MQVSFDRKKFAKDIKTKRVIDLKVDLRTVADEVGISPATLSRCENEGNPDLLTTLKICHWLGHSAYLYVNYKKIK